MRFIGYVPEHDLPVKVGDEVTIAKGVTVYRPTAPKSQKRETVTKRRQTVKVHHILPGMNTLGCGEYHTHNNDPKIVWAGAGGYWSEVRVQDLVDTGSFSE